MGKERSLGLLIVDSGDSVIGLAGNDGEAKGMGKWRLIRGVACWVYLLVRMRGVRQQGGKIV